MKLLRSGVSDVSSLPPELKQHHRTEADGVYDFGRRAREGLQMPYPSVRQQEFPFQSRIAFPECVQPLPVSSPAERSSEPAGVTDFPAPSAEAIFPGRESVGSEAERAACEVHALQH